MIKNKFIKDFLSSCKGVLHTNNDGEYFMLCEGDYSKYQGLIFSSNMEVYKTLDRINLVDSKIIDIIYNSDSIDVNTDKGNQKFVITQEGLLYENFSKSSSEFIFDCRKIFDMSDFERYHEIFQEDDFIIIEFLKKKEGFDYEDDFKFYIALKSDNSKLDLIDKWVKKNYEFDSLRGDKSERYVYNAFVLDTKRCAISFSENKVEAKQKAEKLYDSNPKKENFIIKKINADNEVELAYNLSVNSLISLTNTSQNGIYAGIPWFMQFWTRDFAMSCNALAKYKREFVKDLLYNSVNKIRSDGLIPNRFPHSNLDSIDSTGLVFLRIYQNIDLFNNDELKLIYEKLKKSIDSILIHHFNGFVINKSCETWMDTQAREGARIEIQCLLLAMFKLARDLSSKFEENINFKFFDNKIKDFSKSLKEEFIHKKILYDGLNDSTQRPNIFLAYYFYPDLLEKKEWEIIFFNALKSLFISWGSLSTIDLQDFRFVEKHAGMSNSSYHNGDSWYYINNLAALCMYDVNKEKFGRYINKIIQSSTHEILNMGIFGYHSEISSAYKQESNGCLAQAWSSALYIEMIEKIYKS